MAGDISVDASSPRHAQRRVAEAPHGPAQPAPVSPGNAEWDAAQQQSRQSQGSADRIVNEYWQANDELPEVLAGINRSGRPPKEKAFDGNEAFISVAKLHQNAVDAADVNVHMQSLLDDRYHSVPELGNAEALKQALDTPLGHARYTESHVKQLSEGLERAKKSGVAPAALARTYNEAVSNNLARWRVATNNALRARDHAKAVRENNELNGNFSGIPVDAPFEKDLEICQQGLIRAEQLANTVAPARRQTPIEIAQAAKKEMNAKLQQLTQEKAQPKNAELDASSAAVGGYVKVLESEYRELVVSNFEAWRGALSSSPQTPAKDVVLKELGAAGRLLAEVAPDLLDPQQMPPLHGR